MSTGRNPASCGEPSPSAPVAIDHGAIFTSVGEVAYEWRLDTDAIVWGANVGDVLPLGDLRRDRDRARLCATGRAEQRALARRRGDARELRSIEGRGVPYQLQYALRLPGASAPRGSRISVAGSRAPTARPLRAHGVVRVINERHEREERLAYLSHFDALTGEMNRWHLTELLEASIEEAIKLRSSCGFLLAAIDNLGRINEPTAIDVADEVIAAVAKRIRSPAARQGSSRPLLPATSSG